MSIEQLPGTDGVLEELFSEWCNMQGAESQERPLSLTLTPPDLIDGVSYWFTFSRPDWKRPRRPSTRMQELPEAMLIKFLDMFLSGRKEVDLAGIVVRRATDTTVYEVELGAGIKVDSAGAGTIESLTTDQSVCINAEKNGSVIIRIVASCEDDDYSGMRECSWSINEDGITELTESGRKGRHHPAHGNWSFHGSEKFESYHQVKSYLPVFLSDGSEVLFAKGKVSVLCDDRKIELDYDNNLLIILDKNGRWEHPRPTVTGKNGEVLHLHGVEELYGSLAVNWTVNDLKIETRSGGMIEVENILGQRGSIYFERKKA